MFLSKQDISSCVVYLKFNENYFPSVYGTKCEKINCSVHIQDQSTLLEETWSQLFLLNASYWPVDLGVLVLRIYTGRSNQELIVSSLNEGIKKWRNMIFPKMGSSSNGE